MWGIFLFVIVLGLFGAILLALIGFFISIMLPSGHRINVMMRRWNWQLDHPGKKHPFKY